MAQTKANKTCGLNFYPGYRSLSYIYIFDPFQVKFGAQFGIHVYYLVYSLYLLKSCTVTR